MTVTGGGTDDEQTHVDREPPSFPSVGDSSGSTTPSFNPSTLFSAPSHANGEAQTSPIVSKPMDAKSDGGRGNRLRWLVAGVATILVVALLGGVLFLAAPRTGAAPATSHYVPADTGMYAEIRLDLPGDQKDNLAAFMSHFPGFADQASFQQKLDESLNTVLSDKTNGAVDWTNDVKPWFGGQVAVFGNASPATSPESASAVTTAQPQEVVIAFAVSDKTKLQSVIDSKAGNAQVSSSDYRGQQIKTIAQPAGTSHAYSYVVTDDTLLVSSDTDLLKQALDVKAGQKPALADEAFFTQQLASLHADRLATIYYDASQQLAAMSNQPLPSDLPLPAGCMQAPSSSLANYKFVGEARAENDHLAFTMRHAVATGDGASAPTNHQTTLAQAMPSDTLFYFEMHNAGASAGSLIKTLLSCESSQTSTGPLPSALGGLGDSSQLFETLLGANPEDFLDFIQDAAVGVTYTNDKLGGGLVATVDDQAVAQQRVGKLLGLIKLAGGFGGQSTGAQIASDETDHNGTKVTTIHIVTPAPACPAATACPDAAPLTLQVAVANGRLYLGMDDFVTAALDRSASDSLASSARYQKAISDAPADNTGIVFVDVANALAVYEDELPADEKQQFVTNVKPFLDPLGSFSVVNHVDGGTVVTNAFLFVE